MEFKDYKTFGFCVVTANDEHMKPKFTRKC